MSTLRCFLLYGMLLWLNQFLSALYSPIFKNSFNRSDIRLDSLKEKVAPNIVIKMYTKCYLTSIHQMNLVMTFSLGQRACHLNSSRNGRLAVQMVCGYIVNTYSLLFPCMSPCTVWNVNGETFRWPHILIRPQVTICSLVTASLNTKQTKNTKKEPHQFWLLQRRKIISCEIGFFHGHNVTDIAISYNLLAKTNVQICSR